MVADADADVSAAATAIQKVIRGRLARSSVNAVMAAISLADGSVPTVAALPTPASAAGRRASGTSDAAPAAPAARVPASSPVALPLPGVNLALAMQYAIPLPPSLAAAAASGAATKSSSGPGSGSRSSALRAAAGGASALPELREDEEDEEDEEREDEHEDENEDEGEAEESAASLPASSVLGAGTSSGAGAGAGAAAPGARRAARKTGIAYSLLPAGADFFRKALTGGGASAAAGSGSGSASLGGAGVGIALPKSESRRLLQLALSPGGRSTGSPLHAALAHPSQAGKRDALLRSLFISIDTDGSDSIEPHELVEYLSRVRAKLGEVRARLGLPAAPGAAASSVAAVPAVAPSGGAISALADDDIAPDGVPLAFHMAIAGVLEEAGDLDAQFKR